MAQKPVVVNEAHGLRPGVERRKLWVPGQPVEGQEQQAGPHDADHPALPRGPDHQAGGAGHDQQIDREKGRDAMGVIGEVTADQQHGRRLAHPARPRPCHLLQQPQKGEAPASTRVSPGRVPLRAI